MKLAIAAFAVAACGTEPTQVDLLIPGTPDYFRGNIAGTWQTFTGAYDGKNTTYTLSIDGDFELVLVCEASTGIFNAAELFGTADDATVSIGSWNLPTCTEPPPDPGTSQITGEVDQSGFVAIGTTTVVVNDPSMAFKLEAPNGVRDLAFTNFNFSVGLVHDISISGPTDLGTYSFSKASPMLTSDYEVSLVAGETTQAQTQLITRNGTVLQFNYDPKMAVFVAPDQLAYGDVQTFAFVAGSPNRYRVATATNFADVPPQFDLLGTLQPFRWDQVSHSLTWTPLTDFFTSVSAEFRDGVTGSSQIVTTSKLWLERHATTTIAFDDAPPGYRSSWQTSTLAAYATAEAWSPGLILTSQIGAGIQTVR